MHIFLLQNICFHFTGNAYPSTDTPCSKVYLIKETWLVLSRRVRILTWKNCRLACISHPALCCWLDWAYFEEIKQLVSCLFCLCFILIHLYRFPFQSSGYENENTVCKVKTKILHQVLPNAKYVRTIKWSKSKWVLLLVTYYVLLVNIYSWLVSILFASCNFLLVTILLLPRYF